ncbi:GrpB family protein [Heyndrickxia acidicola]|uniref:GrpB family protein n=1 Tax=Heyndrickxia acidicola TaxID=209389 RepID=A0ABU6MD88_9BACI|nr:GrpB family protein [Heyndrickxia acidicola]MED1202631.1 GrpB family protein [Heyndrickxia acidicola]
MREVRVVCYDASWKDIFWSESFALKEVLKDNVSHIHHIGSTAIPGMSAKPIIDILIEAYTLEAVDSREGELGELGYSAYGENGILNRRFFSKGGDRRTHHVHIYQAGDRNIERHLAFRDYLISYPEKAKEYSGQKRMLAAKYPCDIEGYIAGKDELVKRLEAEALFWYRSR